MIRAEVIRWLCMDQSIIRYIDPKGLGIVCARIEGLLDLAHLKVPFPLVFVKCSIRGGVDLRWSETQLLSFPGSYSGPFTGAGLAVRGDLFLCDGFQAEGELQLSGATITGRLDCTSGVFRNPGSIALRGSRSNGAKNNDPSHVVVFVIFLPALFALPL